MKLTCAVIDDEPLALELMESYVRKTPFLELEGAFGSGSSAYEALQAAPVDLIFCDIQMPGLNGMELSRMLPKETRIIFTTTFSDFAIEGFRVNAVDYLMKTISYKDFLEAAQKALDYFNLKREAAAAGEKASGAMGREAAEESGAAAGSGAEAEVRSIFVKTEYRLQQIDLDSILYIEGMKDYVRLVTGPGDPVISLMNMKGLYAQLPRKDFFRVHKSYSVRLDKIKTIERDRIVFGNQYIPISENCHDEFFEALSRQSIFPKGR